MRGIKRLAAGLALGAMLGVSGLAFAAQGECPAATLTIVCTQASSISTTASTSTITTGNGTQCGSLSCEGNGSQSEVCPGPPPYDFEVSSSFIVISNPCSISSTSAPNNVCPESLSGGNNFNSDVVTATCDVFVGTPGQPNCHGKTVSGLNSRFGNQQAAAMALGYSSEQDLQTAIKDYCGN